MFYRMAKIITSPVDHVIYELGTENDESENLYKYPNPTKWDKDENQVVSMNEFKTTVEKKFQYRMKIITTLNQC